MLQKLVRHTHILHFMLIYVHNIDLHGVGTFYTLGTMPVSFVQDTYFVAQPVQMYTAKGPEV